MKMWTIKKGKEKDWLLEGKDGQGGERGGCRALMEAKQEEERETSWVPWEGPCLVMRREKEWKKVSGIFGEARFQHSLGGPYMQHELKRRVLKTKIQI